MADIRASGLHFHDLRHTGNAWAATSGAGLRDLMARMGHDNERAAIIYQHQARGADTSITRAIEAHAAANLRRDDDGGSAGAPAPPAKWPANGPVILRVRAGVIYCLGDRFGCSAGLRVPRSQAVQGDRW